MSRVITSPSALLPACGALMPAADYYVSTAGNDKNAGTSATAPWKTVAKVNAKSFAAGDRIFFAFGSLNVGARDVWGGTIPLGAAFDIGPHEAPVLAASTGSG